MLIRPYEPGDYVQLVVLYKQGDLYGGQFDEDRDSADRLSSLPRNSIIVCEQDGVIRGTVSLLRDSRFALLFRFAIENSANARGIAKKLYEHAAEILSAEGHRQVIVYAPVNHESLDKRYSDLGFNKGNPYTCHWRML